MRITRPPNKPIENYEQYRIVANIGCDKCPYCAAEGIYDAITEEGNIKHKGAEHYKNCYDQQYYRPMLYAAIGVDKFQCQRCGAEWTGNPFMLPDDMYEEMKKQLE